MSQSPQSISKAIEQHQRAIEQEQQSLTGAVQYPFKQAVELQQNTAQILLSGMELTGATQRMGLDLTRSMLRSYLDVVEGTLPADGGSGTRSGTTQRQPGQQRPSEYAQSYQPQGATPGSQFQGPPQPPAQNQFREPPAQNQFQVRNPPARNASSQYGQQEQEPPQQQY